MVNWTCRDVATSIRPMSIETLRNLKGWTQEDLAEKAGISQASMSRAEAYEDGVTLRMFRAIAKALDDAPLSDLFATDRTAQEAALLRAYRDLPPDRRAGWDDIVRGVLSQTEQSAQSQARTEHQKGTGSLP